MIDTVAICDLGFKAPTEDELSGYLLDEMVEDMRVELKENRKEWIANGCTIMTDGWTDRRNRTLLNFLVPCGDNMSGPSLDLGDEWEVVNDDGFVYKRRKKQRVCDSAIPTKTSTSTSKHNDDLYIRQRRQIKKLALLNLKEKYSKEIKDWESLSQMLQRTPASSNLPTKEPTPLLALSETQTGNSCKSVLRDLLVQVEVQEAFIQDATTLCNLAEMMCDSHEQVLKQPFFDLPVWALPTTTKHNLIPSDSEDDN